MVSHKTIWSLIVLGWVLAIVNAIWYYKHMAVLPRPQESLTAWLYIAPALIGLPMFIVAEVMLQYKDSGRWGQAVMGAIASLSLVGFIILFRLLFGPK